MATSVTFAYGSLRGPVVESPKADMKKFDYGSLNGAVVGIEAAAPASGAGWWWGSGWREGAA